MAQSINELERREKALDEREAGLNAYAREIQERERDVKVAEDRIATRADIERDDYLFDRINRDNRKNREPDPPVVIHVPMPQSNTLDVVTAAMATIAAFTSVIVLLVNVLGV
jgi:hypothetical protein